MPQGKTNVIRMEIERAARMYRTVKDASQALGIGEKTFVDLCHRYSVETPCERERRKQAEWEEKTGAGRRAERPLF